MERPGHILAITYWPLTNALVTTYTLPYLRIIRSLLPAGSRIYLVTLTPAQVKKTKQFAKSRDELAGEGFISVDLTYQRFGPAFVMKALFFFFKLWRLIIAKKITRLHCWCTPGGAIGYLLSVVTGRPLVLDSFEPHAEAMVETGEWRKTDLRHRILSILEKKQLSVASEIICAAPGMMQYAYQTYHIRREEKYVKPACVDLRLFDGTVRRDRNAEGFTDTDVICVYAGKFGGIYLEQETFDFFAVAASFWGKRFRVLLLTNHSDEEIAAFCHTSHLDDSVVSRRFVPHSQVPDFMSLGDFGICPVKPVPTKKYCSPIKNGEYWALGLPVVITAGISADSDIIARENAGCVLKTLDKNCYYNCCEKIDQILNEAGHRDRIRQLALGYRDFSIAKKIYTEIYTSFRSQR